MSKMHFPLNVVNFRCDGWDDTMGFQNFGNI